MTDHSVSITLIIGVGDYMKKNWFVVFFAILICLIVFFRVKALNNHNSDTFEKKRHAMVEGQIISRNVKDPLVLKAMMQVKRHQFVPEPLRSYAYGDEPLPIGHGQTISQPYIVAYMTEALQLKGNEKVLEIGTGSGYQAAVLAEIVKEVYTIEIVKPLAEEAKKRLAGEGYQNVFPKYGDGYQGWPDQAPFDAIIVTAAPPVIPETLVKQLKEGGRMILPVGEGFQELVLVTKKGGKINKRSLIPVRFVPMTGKVQKENP